MAQRRKTPPSELELLRRGHAKPTPGWRDRWFPHRQLLIRGPQSTHAVHFGQKVQIGAVALLAVALVATTALTIEAGWSRLRAARLSVEMDQLRSTTQLEAQRARDDRELLSRLSDELNARIAERDRAKADSINTGQTLKERQAEIDRLLAVREAAIDRALAERTRIAEERDKAIAERDAALAANHDLIGQLSDQADSTIAEVERIIAATGLDPNRLAPLKPPIKDDRNAPRGGPFIPWISGSTHDDAPTGAPSEAPRLVSLSAALDRLDRLRLVLAHLPVSSPVRQIEVSSPFGYRIDPINNQASLHEGVDLRGNLGSPIYATAEGVVVAARRDADYGGMVDIDHGYGLMTRYAHMSRLLVKQGDRVALHQQIGAMGATGRATGVHLHYETRVDGRARNPLNFIKADHYVAQSPASPEPASHAQHPGD